MQLEEGSCQNRETKTGNNYQLIDIIGHWELTESWWQAFKEQEDNLGIKLLLCMILGSVKSLV